MSTSTLPLTQRAWRVTAQGPPSKALRLETDLPVPQKLKPGNVLIKVQAGALNPVDYKLMKLLPNFAAGRPIIVGLELAGTIADANGTEWREGDAVIAHIDYPLATKTKQGALAEYIFAPAGAIAKRPENITPIQAAGIPLAGQTAWQALFREARLKEGQSVFINGGSTAVGSFAIQFAKAKGIHVTTTASGKNEGYVRSLGADEFIDYTKINLAQYLSDNPPERKYDAFLEAVGLLDNPLYLRSEKYLAPDGVFVTVGPQPSGFLDAAKISRLVFELARPGFLGGVKRKYRLVSVKTIQEDMKAILELVAEGKVRPIVDSVYEFEDLPKAFDRLMTKRATGKVVVKVDPNTQ